MYCTVQVFITFLNPFAFALKSLVTTTCKCYESKVGKQNKGPPVRFFWGSKLNLHATVCKC